MFDGCGESITYELTNFNKGWLLKILILILYMCYSYIFKSNKAKLVSLLLILFFYKIYSWLYKCFNKFVVNYDYNVYINKDCLHLLQYTGKIFLFADLAPGARAWNLAFDLLLLQLMLSHGFFIPCIHLSQDGSDYFIIFICFLYCGRHRENYKKKIRCDTFVLWCSAYCKALVTQIS